MSWIGKRLVDELDATRARRGYSASSARWSMPRARITHLLLEHARFTDEKHARG